MYKILLALSMVVSTQSAFAIKATAQTFGSLAQESLYSTAMTSVTSEISSYSLSETRKKDALKIQTEVQVYNQTGEITSFLGEKMSIINKLDSTLSDDEIVDVLLAASELILLE